MAEQIIEGLKPINSLSQESLGEMFYNYLLNNDIQHQTLINGTSENSISYKTLFLHTCKLAVALQRAGLQQNDVIAICSENSLQFFQPIIAGFYLGIISAPINFMYTANEIFDAISISQPKIIFCSSISLLKILEIMPKSPFVKKIILLDSKNDRVASLEDFINFEVQNFSPLRNININEQVAAILSSSGTTGVPKGVMVTHRNVQTKMLAIQDPRLFVQSSNEKVLVTYPFFHSSGFMTTLGFLLNSYKIIFLPKYDEQGFLGAIEKYKINSVWVSPTVVVNLIRNPHIHEYDLSSLREIISGGSTLSKKIEEELKAKLKILVRQSYGLTESTKAVVIMPLSSNCPGSIGKVVPHMMAKVVDLATDKILGPGQVGELFFKGSMVSKGYYNNVAATVNTIDECGWLRTGDIGYYNVDSYFFIVDRVKNIIKYNSYQVSPAELEEILMAHPKIKEAAVIGIPDDVAGELPAAFVIKQPNVNIHEEEIQRYVAVKVSPQKRLRGGVFFMRDFPKTALGKVMRNKLRETIVKKKSNL